MPADSGSPPLPRTGYGAPVLAHLYFDFSEIGWDAAVAIGTGVLALSTGALAARRTARTAAPLQYPSGSCYVPPRARD